MRLIIGVVLLLAVILLLAIAGMRSAGVGFIMAGNEQYRQNAFAASETGIEQALGSVRGTRSAFAERTSGGYFLDFNWKRDELARYGLSMDDAQMVVMSAIGGDTASLEDAVAAADAALLPIPNPAGTPFLILI